MFVSAFMLLCNCACGCGWSCDQCPFSAAGHRRLLDANSISNVRSGPDGSQIAVDLADATSSVPTGTATADAVGVTALKVWHKQNGHWPQVQRQYNLHAYAGHKFWKAPVLNSITCTIFNVVSHCYIYVARTCREFPCANCVICLWVAHKPLHITVCYAYRSNTGVYKAC